MSTPESTRAGRLILVPNTLDLGASQMPLQDVLSASVIAQAAALRHWACEDARSTRAFLKRVDALSPLVLPLQALDISELPRPRKGSQEEVPASAWQSLLAPALAGNDVGLLSEAGMPAVADPGAALVAAAHANGVPVVPLAGPSSLLLSLAASGLNGQSFAFVGYLPQDATARSTRIKDLEALSRRAHQTQMCIETPYRNAALMAALLQNLAPQTRLSVSSGLTLPQAWTCTQTVAQWRRQPAGGAVLSDKLPAVFLWLAG